jgi:hypothetical protein
MLFRQVRLAVALMLALSVGGHWLVLQSVAWVGMAIDYSREMPLDEAMSSTFDGSRPCALCKAIQQGREEERKQSLLKPGQEFKGFLHALPVWLSAPCVAAMNLIPESMPPVRFFSPPHPPPRGL